MLVTACLVCVGVLLVPVVEGRATASSPESVSLNELATKRPTAKSGARAAAHEPTTTAHPPNASTSTTPPLSNEVLPERTPDARKASTPAPDTVPDLNRDQVSLALPDDLFSSTANLTLQLRNFIGDFITRTSVRIAQVVRFFQPLFGYHLMIDIPKEMDV